GNGIQWDETCSTTPRVIRRRRYGVLKELQYRRKVQICRLWRPTPSLYSCTSSGESTRTHAFHAVRACREAGDHPQSRVITTPNLPSSTFVNVSSTAV
ncbi:hypothetical protein B0H14DRAFT_3131011, partial [Mycena olivaceomarginata]